MSQPTFCPATAKILARYGEQMIGLIESLDPAQLWAPGPGNANSIGTLGLHLAGNLRHYLGAGLLADGYTRDRPAEFADRDVPKERVLAGLREALSVAERAIATVDDQQADGPHRSPDGREFTTLTEHVIHLVAHLAYHTGQADYAARGLK